MREGGREGGKGGGREEGREGGSVALCLIQFFIPPCKSAYPTFSLAVCYYMCGSKVLQIALGFAWYNFSAFSFSTTHKIHPTLPRVNQTSLSPKLL